jgi:glycine oxidase
MGKVLIVGQGIAGSVLALTLHAAGVPVHVADSGDPRSSTRVAAGILNPVTGKRYALSWRYDSFFQVAQDFYQRWAQEAGEVFWEDHRIERMLRPGEELNNWSLRQGQPEFAPYMRDVLPDAAWAPWIPDGFQCVGIAGAARVRFPALLAFVRRYFEAKSAFFSRKINEHDLPDLLNTYNRIIFCEGYQSVYHTHFAHLPWQLSKGVAWLLQLPAEAPRVILKRTLLLAPLDNGLFWAGSNNLWDWASDNEGNDDYLHAQLREMLRMEYTLVERLAAVRPTVKDRRPLIGHSRLHPRISLFNGTGTKGGLLTPWLAQHFTRHLLEGLPLDAAIDLERTP